MLVVPPWQRHHRWGTASTPCRGLFHAGSWRQHLCIIQNQPITDKCEWLV